MKATPECRLCLQRLARQAVELATPDKGVRKMALERSLQLLDEQFSTEKVSIVVATAVHRAIREVTGNSDPYWGMKVKEIELARELFPVISRQYGSGLSDCVRLAALGNTVDFFRDIEAIKADMLRPLEFTADNTDEFALAARGARNILFLADNAGEMIFDLPLLKMLRQTARVIYVVKSSPVQDDITLEEIRYAGLQDEIGEIMTTGTATPGVDFSAASVEFRAAFDAADLIFAKGMGYYESLTELPAWGRTFHCLMAKCKPVAESLGVPLHSYVMKRR
jgi:uncharacterized protein with ATP-grasp and redox domains